MEIKKPLKLIRGFAFLNDFYCFTQAHVEVVIAVIPPDETVADTFDSLIKLLISLSVTLHLMTVAVVVPAFEFEAYPPPDVDVR